MYDRVFDYVIKRGNTNKNTGFRVHHKLISSTNMANRLLDEYSFYVSYVDFDPYCGRRRIFQDGNLFDNKEYNHGLFTTGNSQNLG